MGDPLRPEVRAGKSLCKTVLAHRRTVPAATFAGSHGSVEQPAAAPCPRHARYPVRCTGPAFLERYWRAAGSNEVFVQLPELQYEHAGKYPAEEQQMVPVPP